MRLNRYLASTLLTGLFVTASVFIPSALAQEQSLKPQGDWSVTKIDRAAQGGNSYCTLSRKFDNGTVLSLGRNQTEEYSLAIDFQKDVFERGKSLKINLQPGPGQIRAYDMMPASEKAVVVRLGWDTGFFDALNKSQQMKVQIGDQNYAFALPEIAKGQQNLTGCMEELQVAAKAAKGGAQNAAASKDVLNADPAANKEFDAGKVANNAAPTAAPVSAKAQVEAQEQMALKSFASNVQAQESAGKNDAPARRNFGSNSNDDVKVADAKTPVVAPTGQQQPELVKRPAPLAVASQQAAAPVAAAAQDDARIKAMQKQIADLQAQNASLQQKAAASSGASADVQKQIADLQAKNAEMHQQLVAAGEVGERAVAMQKQIADLSAQNKALTEKAAQPSPEIQQQLAKAEAEKLELKKQVQQLADHNQALQPSGMTPLPDETQALKAVKADNAKLQKQIADLSAQNQTLAQKAAAPQSAPLAATEKAAFEKEIDALKKQNTTLQQAAAAAAAGQEAVASSALADAEKASLEKQIEDLKAQNIALQQTKGAPAAGTPADTSAMAQQMASVQAEKAALEQKVAAMQKAQANGKGVDVALDARVKELEAKNSQLEDSLRQAQVRIGETAINTESKSFKQISELESKLQAAQADNNALAKQLESLRTQSEDKMLKTVAGDWNLESATKRFNEAEREVRRLGLQLEQERTSCNREKADIEKMLFDPAVTEKEQQARLSELEAKLQTANDTIAQLQAGGPAVASQSILAISPAAGGPSGSTWEARAETKALRDQNAQLRQDIDNLKLQLADAATNGGTRADQVASVQLQLDETKRQMAMKDRQLATYQSQLAVRSDSGAALASITPAAGTVSAAAATATSERTKPVVQASTAAAKGSSSTGYDKSAIQSLLQKSGLSIGGVSPTSSGFSGADNFAWTDSSNVQGLASVKMLGGKNFDDLVAQYIDYQKGQCGGDFASIPSDANGGGKRMALYEVACVGSNGNQSASLIFFEDQGRFIAIANQIQAADMDLAMDSRDKIAGFVRGL